MKTVAPNTDLALYDITTGRLLQRPLEECVPPVLEPGHAYPFAKPGHRSYPADSPVTLMEINKDEVLFSMKAQVDIKEPHFEMRDGKAYTAGTYVVRELIRD